MSGIMQPEQIGTPGSLELAERTIATNLLGTIRLVEAFLPHLRTRPEAAILTVTSGLAYVPLSATPTYSEASPQPTMTRSPSASGTCR